ncbi:uncharacterized protein LOC132193569 [Neocloeon triangulifer]|uniref:uncharacterized protein LOC132193569 n=1 Tax=Neocloeon triangulifer TaxID=2078957 RepID=UPI00286F4268|nr:uncharacterized protein LOC132193569 [Neocloeon triangulifer]
MAVNQQPIVQPRLVMAGGFRPEAIELLRRPVIPTMEEVELEFTKADIMRVLSNNGKGTVANWDKRRCAEVLLDFLETVDRTAEPGSLCGRCHVARPTEIFSVCWHFGICVACRESILEQDMRHSGNNREAFCIVCHTKHTAIQVKSVNLI